MKKINLFLLGFALLTSTANAQSAKEIFNSISTFPNEKEILAELKTEKPFNKILTDLNDKINKYDNSLDNTEELAPENYLKQMGVEDESDNEKVLSNMNISKADLKALEEMDDDNPAKLALAMKISMQYNNSDFAKQANQQGLAMANRMHGLPEDYKGGELTEEQEAEIEKRGELIEKVSEYKVELMTTYHPIVRECDQQLNTFSNDYEEDKESKELYDKLNNLKRDKTDSDNHAATLAAINKFNREYHDIYSQIVAKKLNKQLDILRNTYNKLKPAQEKLIKMDESMVQFNKNMKNGMENLNEVREMLIDFAKMYKTTIEGNVPQPLKIYKTWEEYQTEDMY